jgi:type IV secretory pathway VirJ component
MRRTAARRKTAPPPVWALLLLAVAAAALTAFAIFGYFDRHPIRYVPATGLYRRDAVAVFLSGDMGLRLGAGRAAIDALRARGVPVLSLSAPGLFGRARDRAFLDRLMDHAIRDALARSRASRVALVGSSFGADLMAVAAGSIRPDLKPRIASVVLLLPSVPIWFHANPTRIFYRGPADADAAHAATALAGLPVTCVSATNESASLCRLGRMAGARQVRIRGGHMMLGQHALFGTIAADAVDHPAEPMR